MLHTRNDPLLHRRAGRGCIVAGDVVMLQLFCPRVSRHRVPDASTDNVLLEEVVDGFQRHVLRLGHTEDRVDAHHYAA